MKNFKEFIAESTNLVNNKTYTDLIKSIATHRGWDEKPEKSKEGASTVLIGKVNGKRVDFQFFHPDRHKSHDYIFAGVDIGGSMKPEFNKSSNKIWDHILSSPSTSAVAVAKGYKEALDSGAVKENIEDLKKAIKKYLG